MSRFYEFGQFRLDAADRIPFRDDELVPLPPKVAETLEQGLNIHACSCGCCENLRVIPAPGSALPRTWFGRFVMHRVSKVFAAWFQGARERVPVLRLVLPSDSRTVGALARLRLENLDSEILGGEFPETAIRVSAKTDHFELMSAEDVLRQADELVAETRAFRAQNS